MLKEIQRKLTLQRRKVQSSIQTSKAQQQFGGYLKITVTGLQFLKSQKFPDPESVISIKVKVRDENPKISRPIIVKWQSKKSLKQKYKKIFQGVDKMFHDEIGLQTSMGVGGAAKENQDDSNAELFVYLGENTFVFDCTEEHYLTMEIYKKKLGNGSAMTISKINGMQSSSEQLQEKIGYVNFPVRKIVKLQKITHQLEIYFLDAQLAKAQIMEDIALMELQMVYLSQDIGTLELRIIQAKINEQARQEHTGILTSLTPYLEIKTKKQTMRTKTDQKGGSNPIWNQTKQIAIRSLDLEKEIQMILLNQNFGRDQIIGSISMDMLNEDILKYTKIKHIKNVGLKDKQEREIGILKFQTRFRINTF